jgi:ribosomal protein L9
VVPVKPGRARNFLVPEKFAAYASVERLAEAQHKQSFWVADSSAVVDVDELALKVRPPPLAHNLERCCSLPLPVPCFL